MLDFSPLSLAQVEGKGYRPYETENHDQSDYFNYSRKNHYLLCWNQWEVFQAGQPDLAGKLNWMQIDWYDTPPPCPSSPSPWPMNCCPKLCGWMKISGGPIRRAGTWQISKHSDSRVNFLSTALKEGTLFQTAAVAIGDKVVLVRYTGHGELIRPSGGYHQNGRGQRP